jgi:predicted transcriptional regulator
MAKSAVTDVLEVFVLYLVNVSQPLGEADVTLNLQSTRRFSSWNFDTTLQVVRRALADLADQGYVRQVTSRYFVTYSGVQLLAERKLAFPRDKNRMYFLKEALRRRG